MKIFSVNNFSTCALAMTSLLIGQSATAQTVYTEHNKTISHLGVQGANAYVQFVGGVGQPCPDLYISDQQHIKMLYTQLLSAKISGKPISRLDYYLTSSGVCVINLVELS